MNDLDYLKDFNIQHRINTLSKKYKNKKIVIYGAGKFSNYIFENYDLSKLNIIAVCDKKFETTDEKEYFGKRGIEPNELKNLDIDVLIIFNKNAIPIMNFLFEIFLQKKDKENINVEWLFRRNILYYLNKKFKNLFSKSKPNEKYIFTFWEPKCKIPAYVNLCMKTWDKILSDYKIVVLDYENLEEWLGFEYYDEYLYSNFSLPQQADAIRAAILYKYGGIWLDADTIITSDKIEKIINQKEEVTLLNYHVGFISAKKGAKFLKKWIKHIKRRIFLHKLYRCFSGVLKYIYLLQFMAQINSWMYLANGIFDEITGNLKPKELLSLNRMTYFALPENNFYEKSEIPSTEKYLNFYFNNDFSEYVFEKEKGIIMLHNSWTPEEILKMNEEDFINKDCTLSKVLRKYVYGE